MTVFLFLPQCVAVCRLTPEQKVTSSGASVNRSRVGKEKKRRDRSDWLSSERQTAVAGSARYRVKPRLNFGQVTICFNSFGTRLRLGPARGALVQHFHTHTHVLHFEGSMDFPVN